MTAAARPTQPAVSIVTPMYNAGRFIGATMDSVAAQTFANWEHLLVDDGSNDDTLALAQGRAAVDDRFVVLRTAGRAGALEARNTGLDAARGRYVAFLDADDLWLATKLERQVGFMEATGAAISHTAYRRFGNADGTPGRVIQPPARIGYRDLLGNTAILMSAGMVDARQFGDLRVPAGGHPSLRSDLRFWLRCLRGGALAQGLNEDLVRYRVVDDSLSSNPLRSAYWVWRTYRDCERLSLWTAGRGFAAYAFRAAKKRLG
jgi:teichuronic acid biosynthesis glycosyltransferase TuaG